MVARSDILKNLESHKTLRMISRLFVPEGRDNQKLFDKNR